jgi:PEP-CTERM motif/Protein of unknown function (DUF642)
MTLKECAAIMLLGATCPAWAQANLIVNGGFEQSTSETNTPTGWVNVGHQDGVISYDTFGTPAYEGSYYYDLGGYGDSFGPIGDGIKQTFSTTIGNTYHVSFGLSSENISGGNETLTVQAGSTSVDYLLTVPGGGAFLRPFVTEDFEFVATDNSTTLSFIHTAGPGGYNDPLIDGVDVYAAAAAPEPATSAMFLFGLGAIAKLARRKNQ